MLLDYSIPNDFQFLIGGVDYAKYLDNFSIALPIYEPGQPLSWSGGFTLSFNHHAIRQGLTAADFDQAASPNTWRPGLQPVRMVINGYDLPVMRIERYSYNAQTREGTGTLNQIINVVDYDRPQINDNSNPSIFGDYSIVTVYGSSLTQTVQRLLELAFRDCSVSPTINSGTQVGGILGGVTTRNPISDCNRLLASQWQWLTVDNNEAVQVIEPNPVTQAANWSRALTGVEIDGDVDHNHSPATRFIVTGSFQREEPLDCQTNPPNPTPNLDRKGRPTFQRTEEKQPFSVVFDGQTGLTPTLSLVKWIFYQYPDDLQWDFQLWQFIPANLIFELQQDQPLRNAPIDQPCQTVTVEQWPAGRIFADLGTNTNLRVAVITYQSERRRAIYRPAGVLDDALGANFTLVQDKYEKLLTDPVILGQELHGGTIDPTTGRLQCLEPPKQPEERQPAPKTRTVTQAVKGEARLTPLGWTPIVENQVKVVDLGFVPGDAQATKLAQRLGFREQIRRDTYKVIQPLPVEWLAANCPPLPVVQIAGDRYLAQGLIIAMQADELRFAYSAARITYGGQLGSVEQVAVDAGFVVDISVTVAQLAGLDSGFVVDISTELVEFVPTVDNQTSGFIIDVAAGLIPELAQLTGFKVGVSAGLMPELPQTSGFKVDISTTLEAAGGVNLTYASDGDTNGLFYYYGTAFATTSWSNPINSSMPTLASTTFPDSAYNVTFIADRTTPQWASDNFEDSWIAFDLGSGHNIAINKYYFKARPDNTFLMPRNWVLEGATSVSGWTVSGLNSTTWSTINSQSGNTALSNTNDTLVVTVTGAAAYRYLRLRQVGTNASDFLPGSKWIFILQELEFYGVFN